MAGRGVALAGDLDLLGIPLEGQARQQLFQHGVRLRRAPKDEALGLAGGDVAGISVSGGKIILTGTTRNAALDVAAATNTHNGGQDA